jgi:DNA topoisomerase-1
MDYNYTALMEAKLDKIEAGDINHVDMLTDFYVSYKKELDKAYIDNGGTLCEKCKAPLVQRENRKTKEKFMACSNYLNCDAKNLEANKKN